MKIRRRRGDAPGKAMQVNVVLPAEITAIAMLLDRAARFCGGPGLDGFCAFMEQEAAACTCGGEHPVRRDVIAGNLAGVAEMLGDALGGHPDR